MRLSRWAAANVITSPHCEVNRRDIRVSSGHRWIWTAPLPRGEPGRSYYSFAEFEARTTFSHHRRFRSGLHTRPPRWLQATANSRSSISLNIFKATQCLRPISPRRGSRPRRPHQKKSRLPPLSRTRTLPILLQARKKFRTRMLSRRTSAFSVGISLEFFNPRFTDSSRVSMPLRRCSTTSATSTRNLGLFATLSSRSLRMRRARQPLPSVARSHSPTNRTKRPMLSCRRARMACSAL